MGFSAYAGATGAIGPQYPENPTHVAGGLPDADEITWVLELRKNHALILINGRAVESSAMDYSTFGYPHPFPKFTHLQTRWGLAWGTWRFSSNPRKSLKSPARESCCGTRRPGRMSRVPSPFPQTCSLPPICPCYTSTPKASSPSTKMRSFIFAIPPTAISLFTGEMYMDSRVRDGLPNAEIDPWTKNNGGVLLYARSTDRLHRYEPHRQSHPRQTRASRGPVALRRQ